MRFASIWAGGVAMWLAVLTCGTAAVWPGDETPAECQILDAHTQPVYRLGLGFTGESRFEDYGDSAMIEFEADWAFAYFRNVFSADLGFALNVRSILFLDSGGINLPNQLAEIAVDVGWTRRMRDLALQARVRPGIYADLEKIDSGTFFFPFSLAVIRSFNPDLSGVAGLDIRPGFERALMPRIGVAWEASEKLRIDAQLPESRLTCFILPDWTTDVSLLWRNTSYRLRDDRDMLTIEDIRLAWGLTYRTADQVEFNVQLGRSFHRSVEFEDVATDEPQDVDISNATFLRVTVGGPF